MDRPATLLRLKDVHSLAQLVGEQFQKLIQTFGNAYTADLLNTVISALEHLSSSVEEVNKLQTRLCKLILENDNLLKEKGSIKATLELKERDNERLKLQLEEACLCNGLFSTHLLNHKLEEKSDDGDVCIGSKEEKLSGYNAASAVELPQMKQRWKQTENELRRTRKKLLNVRATMMCIVSENNMLKTDLVESKALIGLRELQLTRSGCGFTPGEQESPKFYDKDLLAVLRDRNELKEKLEILREELEMTRL